MTGIVYGASIWHADVRGIGEFTVVMRSDTVEALSDSDLLGVGVWMKSHEAKVPGTVHINGKHIAVTASRGLSNAQLSVTGDTLIQLVKRGIRP